MEDLNSPRVKERLIYRRSYFFAWFAIRVKNMPFYEEKVNFSSFHFAFYEGEGKMARTPEGKFQDKLKSELEEMFPGCFITKLDANHIQGIPDLLILWNEHWAVLECKKSANEKHRPNQDYYVDKLNEMSYSSFIFPENKERVLNELQSAFQSRG